MGRNTKEMREYEMNILEEIQNCPVEWKELKDIAILKNGKDWKTLPSGEVPVYGSGGEMGEFVSEYSYDKPTVLIPRKGSISNLFYLENAFWNVDTIYYTEIDDKQIIPKYFFYYLTTIKLEEMATNPTRPSLTQAILDKVKIPIPPLEIQEKIVQILDKMTGYVTELTSELTSRKKQYSFYRDKLLSFEDEVYQVEWKVLKDVATLKNGKDWKNLPIGEIPVYGSGGEMGEFVADCSYDKPTVLIPRKGSISNLFYLEKAFWNVDTIYYTEIDGSQVIPKYFYYYLTTVNLEEMSTNPTRPSLTQAILDKIKIPVPSLEIQSRIVQVLDNFDMVCNDLNIGLPKEIELRQKQYEYFREKLLTFVAEGEYTESRVEEWDNSAIIKLLQWVFGPIRVKVGQVVNLQRGKRLVRKQLTTSGSVPVYQNSLAPLGYYTESNRVKNTSFVICAGAAGEIGYSTVDFWAADDVYTLETSDNISDKFIYYVFLSKQDRLKSQVRKASIPRLSKDAIDKITLYLPSITEQESIVSILDNFNTLTNSLSEGLPKEIELRQKQYEYWRNQLLNFNE